VFEEDGAYPTATEPPHPDPADKVEFEIWREARKEYQSKKKRIEEETIKLFGEVLGQCGKQSIELIRRIEGGNAALESKDVLKLVRAIRTSHMIGSRADTTENFDAAIQKYYHMQMGEYEPLAAYYNRFKATDCPDAKPKDDKEKEDIKKAIKEERDNKTQAGGDKKGK